MYKYKFLSYYLAHFRNEYTIYIGFSQSPEAEEEYGHRHLPSDTFVKGEEFDEDSRWNDE